MVKLVDFIVRVFLDGTPVEPSDYSKIIIANPIVDQIVNNIYETAAENPDSPAT